MAQEKQKILFEMEDNIGDTIDRLSKMSDGLMETHDAMEEMADAGEGAMSTIQDALGTLDTKNLKAIEDVDFGKMIEGIDPGLRTLEDMNATLMQSASDYHDAKIKFEREGTDVARREAEQAKRIHEEKARAIMDTQKEMARNLESQAREAKRVFVDQRQELHRYMEDEFPKKTGQEIGGAVKSALDADPAGMVMGVVGALKTGGEAAFKKASQALEEQKMKKGVFPGMDDGISPEMEGSGMADQAEGAGEMAEAAGAMKGSSKKLMLFGKTMMGVVGGVALLIKLLLDAEKQTIELNEALFESTSLMNLGGGNLDDAVQNMRDLRDAATDTFTQLRLGMDPKEIVQAAGALEKQNIRLNELGDEYNDMGEAAISTLTDIRHASLNLGASTDEVTEFVGNLHDVNSVAMGDIDDQLNLVVHAANQADMHTADFFSTVNQITGQMGLYNFRLEETTGLMSTLSHLMDAETAQEFTEQFATGMKDMNYQDRLRLSLLAGQQDTMERLNAENERMFDGITEGSNRLPQAIRSAAKDVGMDDIESMDQLRDHLAEVGTSSDEHVRLINAVRRENDDLADNLRDATQMAEQLERGGMHTMDAMRHLQAMDHLDMEIQGLENVAGPIETIPGIVAEQMGIDERQLEVMRRTSEYARGQLADIRKVEEEIARQGLTEEEANKAVEDLGEKLDMSLKLAEDGQTILDEQGNELEKRGDVMRHMSEDQLNEIEGEHKTMEDFAQEQVSATQSIGDIMNAVIADLLQTISNGVSFIADLIMKAPFIDGGDMDVQHKFQEEQDRLSKERIAVERQLADLGEDDVEEQRKLQNEISNLADQQEGIRKAEELVEDGEDTDTVLNALDLAEEQGRSFADNALRFMQMSEAAEEMENVARSSGDQDPEDWGGQAGAYRREKFEKFQQQFEFHDNWMDQQDSLRLEGAQDQIQAKMDENDFEELSPEEQEKLLNQIVDEVSDDFGLDRQSIDEMAKRITQEERMASHQDQLFQSFSQTMPRDLAAIAAAKQTGRAVDPTHLTSTDDASILTGGFAPHLFAPGDMIVKADEIASTRTGRAGEFAPDLLSQMGAGSSSGGGRPINMNTTINVSGGSADQVENAVLRAYDMIKRREMGES